MPSDFDCLGFGVRSDDDLRDLLTAVQPSSRTVASSPLGTVLRWQDPSGARLVIAVDTDGRVTTVLPSYDGVPGARLANVWAIDGRTVAADVLDDAGEVATWLAFDLEQRALLTEGRLAAGRGAVVALGVDVRAHSSPEAFTASDASRFAPTADDAGEPARMAPESFISYGLFSDPVEAAPYGLLTGTVLQVAPKRNELSGGAFTVARVRTIGMEVDLCLPMADQAPLIGGTMSGSVYLVGSLPELEAHRR